MEQQIFFHPWVGKDYQTGGIFGRKILVLGESHYCSERCDGCGTEKCADCYSFTEDVLKKYLNESFPRKNWMRTFVKFERSMVNHETDWRERKEIWNSLAFYNYLQIPMDNARQAGKKQQYKDAEGPFFQVLNILKPDIVIVWGYRLWNRLPSLRWKDGIQIQIDDYKVRNGFYYFGDSYSAKTVCVYHPSTRYSGPSPKPCV